MITAGVDLSAEPRGTAVAILEWDGVGAAVRGIVERADDRVLVETVDGADRIGIDCPLGWPDGFVDFVAHHNGRLPIRAVDTADGWRQPLVYRRTDLACIDHTRARLARAVRPLSVSADLLGHVAMRCAVLLGRLESAGVVVDRSGTTGHVAEVYPAACLALWGLTPGGYKGSARRDRLAVAVARLSAAAPWLTWNGDTTAQCLASDHCLDAVVAALAARAVALGAVTRPTAADLGTARREGWIALPTGDLADLAVTRDL